MSTVPSEPVAFPSGHTDVERVRTVAIRAHTGLGRRSVATVDGPVRGSRLICATSTWYDPHFVWNATLYDVTAISVLRNSLWYPDVLAAEQLGSRGLSISLLTRADNHRRPKIDDHHARVYVFANGTVRAVLVMWTFMQTSNTDHTAATGNCGRRMCHERATVPVRYTNMHVELSLAVLHKQRAEHVHHGWRVRCTVVRE
ncbi:unnamed protein product [Sphagnum balticum]